MHRISRHKTGKRIRRLMAERSVTVKELQEQMGLESAQAVYKWLNGKAVPTTENLLMLAKTLNVPMEELIVVEEDREWEKEWKKKHPPLYLAYGLYLNDPVRQADAKRLDSVLENIWQERMRSIAEHSAQKFLTGDSEDVCNGL